MGHFYAKHPRMAWAGVAVLVLGLVLNSVWTNPVGVVPGVNFFLGQFLGEIAMVAGLALLIAAIRWRRVRND